MKRILGVLAALMILVMIGTVSMAAAEDDSSYIKIGDYGPEVVALHQKLSDLGYYHLRPESPWSAASERALRILQENIDEPVTGTVDSKERLDKYLNAHNVIGKNLAVDTSSEWSEWFTPEYNAENRTFNPFYAVLPTDKTVGDHYTCSLEIEFKDVAASTVENAKFGFRTQGSVDGTWDIGNIWNSSIIKLSKVPEDGVYTYTAVAKITEKNVGAEKFNLGFRCDYWSTGSFRVRNVKVERGSRATEWRE